MYKRQVLRKVYSHEVGDEAADANATETCPLQKFAFVRIRKDLIELVDCPPLCQQSNARRPLPDRLLKKKNAES